MEKIETKKSWKDRIKPEEIGKSLRMVTWGWRQLTLLHKAWILSLALCQALSTGIGLWTAMIFRGMINGATAGDAAAFRQNAILLVVSMVISIGISAYHRYMNTHTYTAVVTFLQERTYGVLLRKEFGVISQRHSGLWNHRFYQDVGAVAGGVCSIPSQIASMLVAVIGGGFLLLRLIPVAAFFSIPLLAILALAVIWVGVRLRRMGEEAIQKNEKVSVYLLEHLSSMLILHAYAREDVSKKEMAAVLKERRQKELKKARFSAGLNTAVNVGMRTAYLGGAIICASYILTGQLEYGTFAAVLQLVSMLQGQVYSISGMITNAYSVLLSSERMTELDEFPDDYDGDPVSLEDARAYYHQKLTALGLENITFTYPGENQRTVFNGLDFEVKKGEFVAITGPSGCGKSTLLKLLLDLYHNGTGRRYLADTEEKRPLDASWRNLFAYVPQQNHLLTGTLREVVSFSSETGPRVDEGCWHALQTAGMEESVRSLPGGLDTVLGEKGSGLSEGQMQRLAIARAVYSQRPVLLLDECTSALDEETELQVLKNLRRLSDRTVLIVTHRPAALALCHREYRLSQPGA